MAELRVNIAHLSLLVFQMLSAPSATACGCSMFDSPGETGASSTHILSQDAKIIRDFSLFTHRKIADDAIKGRGLYLDTVLNYFPQCDDRAEKLAWLKRVLISTPETDVFADRVAQMYEAGNACGIASPASVPAETESR